MAKQLVVKLQKPSIELEVVCKDAAKIVDTVIVGFKRYPLEEADIKYKEFLRVNESLDNIVSESSTELNTFIKDSILYIKKAKLEVYDDETDTTIKLNIEDTRKASPVDGLWETSEECLDALLNTYLQSSPYRSSLIQSLLRALINVELEEGKQKN